MSEDLNLHLKLMIGDLVLQLAQARSEIDRKRNPAPPEQPRPPLDGRNG